MRILDQVASTIIRTITAIITKYNQSRFQQQLINLNTIITTATTVTASTTITPATATTIISVTTIVTAPSIISTSTFHNQFNLFKPLVIRYNEPKGNFQENPLSRDLSQENRNYQENRNNQDNIKNINNIIIANIPLKL
ncbi:hypothetical protein Glove_275g31 [Diversispora epigaea]|uniref:Uncharacterized protein n=1 Tax=Diversispora epigaea TaxID=1348612 RepID=A0A397I5C0_9GLOM|nr:hypothetical protein Glove_275g31 [Diversispora epigaea]